MNNSKLACIVKSIQSTISRHSPEILTGIGIAGMVTTTIVAIKATPKAVQLLKDRREELELEPDEKLTPIETVKTCWKCYIPAAITGVTSAACLIGASSINTKRNAALATAYAISETALSEYREKVIETIGENKERAIQEKIDKDHVEKNPVSKTEVIVTRKGQTLCYDYMSGRYFESDIDELQKAITRLSGSVLRNDYASLNDFYDEIDLPHVGIGYDFGWNAQRLGRELIEPRIGSQIADDGRPCVVVRFEPMPAYGYSDY